MTGNKSVSDQENADSERQRSWLKVLNSFAVELIKISDEVDLAWYVAREVVGKLGFVDCVVYFFDPKQNALRQIAAIGAKNPRGNEIANPLEIAIGEGVTGRVAETRQAIIIDDLREADDYIPDLENLLSEICVPLISADQTLGVIDCEDPRLGHFGQQHLEVLSSVAALTSAKLELMQKNHALRKSERRNRLILDSALEGIITINEKGNVTECNSAAERMFGFSKDEL